MSLPSSALTGTKQPATFTLTDLGMLLAVLLWGTNMTVSKIAFAVLPPLAFNALRFVLAPGLLVLILLLTERSLNIPRELRWRVVWLGLIGNSAYQLVYVVGLNITTASNSALLFATTPIWVALAGTVRGTERLSPLSWCGIGLSLVGVALVLAARGAALTIDTLAGDLLVLAAVLCWAAYTMGAGPLLSRVSPLKATALPMIAGAPLIILAGAPDLARLEWRSVAPAGWLGLAYSGIFSIVVAYWLWYSSVRRVGPTRTGVYTSLLPVVGVVAAWIGLGEPIVPVQLLGAAAILLGLWLTRRGRWQAAGPA